MKRIRWRTERGMRIRIMLVEEKQNFIINLKVQVGCDECGIDDPAILVLHHVKLKVQARGSRQPSGFNWGNNGWLRIMKELKKCIVLCLNHHGLEHEKINRKPVISCDEPVITSDEQLELLW